MSFRRARFWCWAVRLGWAALFGVVGLGAPAYAEDVIVTKTRPYSGEVISVNTNGVLMRIGTAGQVLVPREQIVEVRMNPPVLITRGIELFEKGNTKEAAINLGKAVMQFQPLDTDWAPKGLLYYGKACVAEKDFGNAEKVFSSFVAWYPDHAMERDAQIGMAQIALAKKEYQAALDKLTELAQPLQNLLKPEGEAFAQAADIYLTIGACHEGMKAPKEALDAYLKVVALYPKEGRREEALYRAARLYAGMGNFKLADALYGDLIDLSPGSAFAREAVKERQSVRERLKAGK